MKKLVGAVVTLALAAPLAPAQSLARTYTIPCVPPREHLDRLNLKLDWRLYVPMDGMRDGFFSIQILDGGQLLVQTRSGGVVLIDAATGATLWRARQGQPYAVTQPLGYNRSLVFQVSSNRLYALSRATGQQQWDMVLPNAPSAAPVADEENIYLCLGTGRIYVYELPVLGTRPVVAAPKPPEPEEPAGGQFYARYRSGGRALESLGGSSYLKPRAAPPQGPQPRLLWQYTVGSGRLEQAPLLTPEFLTLADSNGVFYTTSKFTNRELYRFRADAAVSAPLGQYGESAYIASQDFNVYALDIVTGKIVWRVLGGAPILTRPYVTDEDVYVVPTRAGLYRINRLTGEITWLNRAGAHFLAMNPKFVYALDLSNRLLVIDRARGTTLSTYDDTRDFVFPIGNELNDRIYLAANDGLLISLHDRDYPNPVRNKNVAEAKKPAGEEKEKGEAKEKGEEKGPKKEEDKGEEKMPAKKAKDKGEAAEGKEK
jgi:outer membrane protein assembly factor BamB